MDLTCDISMLSMKLNVKIKINTSNNRPKSLGKILASQKKKKGHKETFLIFFMLKGLRK